MAEDELLAMLGEVSGEFAFLGRMNHRGWVRFFFQIEFHGPFTAGVRQHRTFARGKSHRLTCALLAGGIGRAGREPARRQTPDQRAAGNFHQQLFAGASVHSFAHAVLAVLRNEPGLVILCDEIVQVVVGLQNNVAATPTVPAGRTAFRSGCFTQESDTTLPAMTGARENFDFVDEHEEPPGGVGVVGCCVRSRYSITPPLHSSNPSGFSVRRQPYHRPVRQTKKARPMTPPRN